MRIAALMLGVLFGLSACKRGEVDTTKDVYSDWDAPEYQLYVVNGTTTQIPWDEVPEGRQWFTEKDTTSILPWVQYRVHVPIVRVDVSALDKEGNPVDPKSGDVWQGGQSERGLNPRHMRCTLMGKGR
ncbi:MAG: hypothetical protein U0441_27725 [Polyangiaceae bacterium]